MIYFEAEEVTARFMQSLKHKFKVRDNKPTQYKSVFSIKVAINDAQEANMKLHIKNLMKYN